MAISHELSGEIATALFAAKERSLSELHDLRQIVFEIHYTLEQLAKEVPGSEARKNRRTPQSTSQMAAKAGKA